MDSTIQTPSSGLASGVRRRNKIRADCTRVLERLRRLHSELKASRLREVLNGMARTIRADYWRRHGGAETIDKRHLLTFIGAERRLEELERSRGSVPDRGWEAEHSAVAHLLCKSRERIGPIWMQPKEDRERTLNLALRGAPIWSMTPWDPVVQTQRVLRQNLHLPEKDGAEFELDDEMAIELSLFVREALSEDPVDHLLTDAVRRAESPGLRKRQESTHLLDGCLYRVPLRRVLQYVQPFEFSKDDVRDVSTRVAVKRNDARHKDAIDERLLDLGIAALMALGDDSDPLPEMREDDLPLTPVSDPEPEDRSDSGLRKFFKREGRTYTEEQRVHFAAVVIANPELSERELEEKTSIARSTFGNWGRYKRARGALVQPLGHSVHEGFVETIDGEVRVQAIDPAN